MAPAREMGQGQGALSAAAAMVAEAKLDLDRLDAELVQHVDSATAAWTGRGATAFTSLGLAWSERQRTILDALDRFEASLLSTERDNTDTDQSQSSVFAHHQRRLG
jgi:uncharacterized protein YukE